MELLAWISKLLSWLKSLLEWIQSVWTWLTSPSIVPWAGAVAAIIAALTVEPKTWLKSPWKSVGRAMRIAVVFLIVAWMLSSVAQLGSGRGSGKGGGSDSKTGKTNGNKSVTVVPGQFPSGTPEHVDLVVSFVPSAANQSVAQDFSCDLLHKGPEKKVTKIEIRGKDMQEFDKLLVQQLRDVSSTKAPERLTVHIKRSPFPGESVVRRVGDKLRTVLSNPTVVFDERSAP